MKEVREYRMTVAGSRPSPELVSDLSAQALVFA